MLNLADLATFLAVADAGGVSPAARRLGLPKSIVSRRLNRLEEELGVSLLTRTTRGAALTEAGATFREHAARVRAELEAARESIAPKGEVQGLLRISAPLSFGSTNVAPVLAELARRHPKLQVHAYYSDRFVDLIGEGFDAAIRIGYLADSSLVARRIAPMHARFVASPAYVAARGEPQTPDEIAHHEVLALTSETWRFREGKRVRVVRPQSRFRADNGQALLPAVLAGLGMAALPDFMVDGHLARGELVRLLADHPLLEAGIYLVRPPGAHAPRKVRALLDVLLEDCGQENPSGTPPRSRGSNK
jgi:DNA-binding transcriptional LysR family regulator